MEDEDPDSDDLFFTSTLLIIDPVNGSGVPGKKVVKSLTISSLESKIITVHVPHHSIQQQRFLNAVNGCFHCRRALEKTG